MIKYWTCPNSKCLQKKIQMWLKLPYLFVIGKKTLKEKEKMMLPAFLPFFLSKGRQKSELCTKGLRKPLWEEGATADGLHQSSMAANHTVKLLPVFSPFPTLLP